MKQYTQYPLFFEPNRVYRVYKGGYLFGEFMGAKKEDGNYPEEWVASTVSALNANSSPKDGLSIIEHTDITLKEAIEQYPKEMLGDRSNFDVLVKYLDSAIRLPAQVHPDKAYSQKYFNSNYGKTEMWLVLDTREDASIWYGFNQTLTKKELSEIVEKAKDDKTLFEKYMNRVPVKKGDVYLIPAKATHAIGYGCLILEVQEPTDFTIQPEYWCGDKLLNTHEMYLGLEKDIALDCFDFSVNGDACIKKAKKQPVTIDENENYKKESIITSADTTCFNVFRYTINNSYTLQSAPAIYVISAGSGVILGEDFKRKVKKGDYFFLPYAASNRFTLTSNENEVLELVECLPSQ